MRVLKLMVVSLMMNLILIHNATTSLYAQIAFFLWAIGNHAFTEYVYYRCALWSHFTYLSFSTAIKMLLVIWGVCLFSRELSLGLPEWHYMLASTMLGWLIAKLLFHFELSIVMRVNRRGLVTRHKGWFKQNVSTDFHLAYNLCRKTRVVEDALGALLLTAISEELLLRYYALSLVMRDLDAWYASAMMVVLAIIFACTHVNQGLWQMICKCHFALIMTASVLLTHATMTAICAHLFFNFYVWAYLKKNICVSSASILWRYGIGE